MAVQHVMILLLRLEQRPDRRRPATEIHFLSGLHPKVFCDDALADGPDVRLARQRGERLERKVRDDVVELARPVPDPIVTHETLKMELPPPGEGLPLERIDGLVYLGRRSGARCLALFGDEAAPKWHQAALSLSRLGRLHESLEFWQLADELELAVF